MRVRYPMISNLKTSSNLFNNKLYLHYFIVIKIILLFKLYFFRRIIAMFVRAKSIGSRTAPAVHGRIVVYRFNFIKVKLKSAGNIFFLFSSLKSKALTIHAGVF